jgi:two-component system, chemotaxis family, CheB/CheR fusion protein
VAAGLVVLHAELPVASVRGIVQQCLTSGRRAGPVPVAVINRIGRSSTCMVTCSPLKDKGDGGRAVLMEEVYRD